MTDNSLSKAIVGELKDELNITEDRAINAANLEDGIFAFYKDLVEAGKPQLLFLKLKDTTEAEPRKSIESNKGNKDGHSVDTDGDTVYFFSLE